MIPEAGWGERVNPSGQVDLISLPEATMTADMRVEGRMAGHALRKFGQFQGYLSAIKLRIAELRSQGKAAASVTVHIHYLSDREPSDETVKHFERIIKAEKLPGLTVYWHRL